MYTIMEIFVPLYLISFVVTTGYIWYVDRQDKKRRKKEQFLDTIPCLCGHAHWMHGSSSLRRGKTRCMDFVWDNLCKCDGYRMDNLNYLEKLSGQK